MIRAMATAATVAVLLANAASAETTEPLTIKGLAPGDSVEKMSLVGPCQFARGGFCIGDTVYGTTPAKFSITYVSGQVSSIMVSFDRRFSRDIFNGLTQRFGESTSEGCKPGIPDCHTWRSAGLSMVMIENVGAVTLSRSSPAGGY